MTIFYISKTGGEQELEGEKELKVQLKNKQELELKTANKKKKKKKGKQEKVPRSVLYRKDFMNYYGCNPKTATTKMNDVRQKLNLEPKSHINVFHLSIAESTPEEDIRKMLKLT